MKAIPVKHIDIDIPNSISLVDLYPYFQNLIANIRPDWASNKITVKVFCFLDCSFL